jgi:eukaryotic-like serine/threonine-protein kinase
MMSSERWRRVESIYHAALSRPFTERSPYLAAACAGDDDLRREVESLLAQTGALSEHLPGESAGAIAAGSGTTTGDPPGSLPGARLGHYHILGRLGVGGMGEVYRARDTKLGRDVAIKTLPPAFISDPERLARFEREARVLASLNHPHIGAIYGLEDSGGVRALVLELIDGQTLADRIRQGPLSLNETRTIAGQLAAALDAAHERGIVHRDFKPANIKITPDGVVKVLDFGIAKASSEAASSEASRTPTVTIGRTREGLMIGTAAYMSPEQARGQSVDKRTDIWAFGAVLYEMLTGQVAFRGDSLSDTLAAVLNREPNWTALPAATPGNIRRLLQRCLEKDPKRRLRDIGDARLEFEVELSEPDRAGPGQRPEKERSSHVLASWWTYAFGAALLILGTAIGWWGHSGPSTDERGAVRIDVSPPAGTKFVVGFGAISPDGQFLAFVAESANGPTLWVRALDSQAAHELPGTDGAAFPFWKPDSRSLGFFASGKLRRVDIAGGTPSEICDVPAGRGGTWNADDVIVYNAVNDGPLLQVPATGGAPRPLTALDATRHENSHRNPMFLPDGRHFLYFIRSDDREIRGIYIGSIERPQERTRVVPSDFSGVYSPGLDARSGYLLWLRNGALVAQPLDTKRFTVSGEPVTVADSIRQIGAPNALSPVSVSGDGTLVYGSSPEPHYQLTWYARDGKPVGTVGTPDAYLDARISPDGQRIAVVRGDTSEARSDVWLMDVGRGVPNRITFEGALASGLAWAPNSQRVAYLNAGSPPNLFVQGVTTAGAAERLVSSRNTQNFPDWSPDGRFLLYAENVNDSSSTTRTDLQLLSLDGAQSITPYLQTPFAETRGRFSPNGKWVAYTSDESGRNDVYIQSFPVGGPKRRISRQGGDFARWRQDGKELFYTALDNTLMAVPIQADSNSLADGDPKPLFKIAGRAGTYDVAPEGQRILALPPARDDAPASMTIVVNWLALLKKGR